MAVVPHRLSRTFPADFPVLPLRMPDGAFRGSGPPTAKTGVPGPPVASGFPCGSDVPGEAETMLGDRLSELRSSFRETSVWGSGRGTTVPVPVWGNA